MNRKKLIAVIAAAAAVIAAVIIAVVCAGRSGTVKTDGLYPYSFRVTGSRVRLKISAGSGWQALETDSENVTVEKKGKRDFEILLSGRYSGQAGVYLPDAENGDYIITVSIAYDGKTEPVVYPCLSMTVQPEKTFGEDGDFPVTVIPGAQGSAEILFPGAEAGEWKTEASGDAVISGGIADSEGMHFALTFEKEGEYTVKVYDMYNGRTSEIRLSADKWLNITPVSAESGTCEKTLPEKEDKGKKPE